MSFSNSIGNFFGGLIDIIANIFGSGNSNYDASKGFGNILAKITGTGLTDAEKEANAFNAAEAEKQRTFNAEQAAIERQWQEQMDNTKVQRSVADMQAAGVNPAMMYGGSGATASTPSGASASGSAASSASSGEMSGNAIDGLLNIIMSAARFKEINAGVAKTKAETDKIKNEGKLIGLQSSYYPVLTESSLREINSRILGNESAANLNDVKAAHERILANISSIDESYRSRMNEAEAKFKEESANSAKASAAADYAKAVIDGLEASYMKEHGTHMPSGSSELVALASWICQNLGTNESSIINEIANTVENGVESNPNDDMALKVLHPVGYTVKAVRQTVRRIRDNGRKAHKK